MLAVFFCSVSYALPFIYNWLWPLLFMHYAILYWLVAEQNSCRAHTFDSTCGLAQYERFLSLRAHIERIKSQTSVVHHGQLIPCAYPQQTQSTPTAHTERGHSPSRSIRFFKLFTLYLIAYTLHLSALLPTFQILASTIIGLAAFITLSCFVALNAAIYYFIVSKFLYHLNNLVLKSLCFILFVFIFTLFLDGYFLWPFGNLEGYCCFHPLVPLVAFYNLRLIIAFLGTIYSTILLLSLSLIMPKLLKNKIFIFICFALYIFLTISKHEEPYKDNSIISFATIFDRSCTKSVDQYAKEIYKGLREIALKYPKSKIIVMPESALPFAINNYPEIILLIQDCLSEFKSQVYLIMGCHKTEAGKLYNCCYCFSNIGTIDILKKKHGLFFYERIPNFFKKIFIGNIFLKNKCEFEQSDFDRPIWNLGNMRLSPLICSELFFANANPAKPAHTFDSHYVLAQYERFPCLSDYPARQKFQDYFHPGLQPRAKRVEGRMYERISTINLAIVNDAWYNNTFLPNLLLNCAILKSINWHSEIIYISHNFSYFISAANVNKITKIN